MKRLLAIYIIIVLAPATSFATDVPDSLFPLQLGYEWTYRTGNQENGIRTFISLSETLTTDEGIKYFASHTKIRMIDRERSYMDLNKMTIYYRDGNTLWKIETGVNIVGQEFTNKKLLLKSPIAIGTAWTDAYDNSAKCKIVALNSTANIEDTSYTNCIVVQRIEKYPSSDNGDHYGIIYEYFCPKIGYIGSKLSTTTNLSKIEKPDMEIWFDVLEAYKVGN
jgi:hypothetical protein